MLRRIQLSLNDANTGKLAILGSVMDEALSVLNRLIPALWAAGDSSKFSALRVETWLSARMQQCLLKQAAETVRSQRRKHHKSMPVVTKATINLDERFLTFSEDVNTFDFWVKFASLGRKLILNVPSRRHSHFLKYREDGWLLRRGGRLRRNSMGWFLDLYMEKAEPAAKTAGAAIGIDTGYKKLVACSDGSVHDAGLQKVYDKLGRRRQGSRAFQRALAERDQLTNQSVNQIDFSNVRTVVAEDLKSVKSGSHGKIRKEFNNKLQRWSYPKVLAKLQSVCEVRGIDFIKVDPAYTSQTCSLCGHVERKSRKGETFHCTLCGMNMDADINAARNILMRGVYSPPPVKQCHQMPF